jgi:ATP-dependent helicase/nuclease subunit B
MKTNYLQRLAEEVSELVKGQSVMVVLPNQRSLFVLKDLLPPSHEADLLTIDDLMQRISACDLIDPEELLVSFYAAYCGFERNPQSFDQFTSWAVTFLGDANDIDLHMVDVGKLYDHIAAYHATGAGFHADGAGAIEQSFLGFWERLPAYYRVLHQALEPLHLGYRGLIYRKVAQACEERPDEVKAWFEGKLICWVGIIPGNPSERILLQLLRDEGIALNLYADIDAYYVDQPQHEAGRLFRAHPLSNDLRWKTDHLGRIPKRVTVHPVPGKVVQITSVYQQLMALPPDEWKETVVVVPDASMILPIVKLFEHAKDRINITSGFPMRSTMIHRFVMSWMNVHAYAVQKGQEKLFYHKHLEEFLGYAVVKSWLSGVLDWDELRKSVVDKNMRYIPLSMLRDKMKGDLFAQEAYSLFFDWEHDPQSIFQKMNAVLATWGENIAKISMARIDAQAIQTYVQKLKLLLSQFNDLLPNQDVRALKKFVHRQIGYSKLYLEEPKNDALQVMGMLETRMIDFKRVIVVAASDESLPGRTNAQTHIPFIHRVQFKLPTKSESEALMAYHFYRLLTRAEEVHLYYDAVGDEMTSGEPSRYILQLEEELRAINPEVMWEEAPFDFIAKATDVNGLAVEKTEQVLEDVRALFKRGVSPSALNKFIQSPLEFYYYHVLRLKEQDTVEEEIEHATFGNLVHKALEHAYTSFLGRFIDPDLLQKAEGPTVALLESLFLEKFQSEDLHTGRNLLMLEMAKQYVRSFLRFDANDLRENGPVKLLYLESFLARVESIGGESVRLIGYADRIDQRNGIVRIIDYKSGRVEANKLNYAPDLVPTDQKLDKALQLAIYKYIYAANHNLEDDQVEAYIFSMKNFTEGYLPLKQKDHTQVLESLPEVLSVIVGEIMDRSLRFEHREDTKYATF